MPIISRIGRKHVKVRALYIGMYAFLILGSASMVYPFLLMISGSTKSAVDIKYFDAVPRFLRNDLWLYRKHQEALFNERTLARNIAYEDDGVAFENVEPPATQRPELVKAWTTFMETASLPAYAYTVGHFETPVSKTLPLHLREYKARLKRNYGGNLDHVNAALGTSYINWNAISVVQEQYLARRDKPPAGGFARETEALKASAPTGMRYAFSARGYYKTAFLKSLYSRDIAGYNRAHGTTYASYRGIALPRRFRADATAAEQDDWEDFVRTTLCLLWIEGTEEAAADYRGFLAAKHGSIATLNRNYGTAYGSFQEIPPVISSPLEGMVSSDWEAFLVGWKDPDTERQHRINREHLRVNAVEHRFQDHLLAAYGDLAGINAALKTDFSSIEAIALPQEEAHHAYFQANRRALRNEFLTRNYKAVADYLLLHGRGIINTVIYCSLAILLALTINPLAAYAMSRYKMPSTYKILLFCMCTMAFPPMVTQIPNFLMLRRLGLLNTFAALVLPGMANGYAIFLLKGFFDSQPRELYDCAQLDGASEWTLFWQIAMSLSKPILAVVALQAFTVAYSNFMFAFVVCQDQKMWTLMVWLYQLQQRSGQAVMYASLIIAAIPTFLVFLFCQNIIMRGIVVPAEK